MQFWWGVWCLLILSPRQFLVCFGSSLWLPLSLLLSTAGHFLLDSRHCAFYPAAWWAFLHSKKSSWGLFWEGLAILSPALESGQVWLEPCSAEVNWGNPRQWIHPWGREAMLAVRWNSPTSGPGWALVTAPSDLLGCCPGFEHLSPMTSGTCCRPKTPLQVSGLRVRCPCPLPGTLDFLSWTLRSMSSIQRVRRDLLWQLLLSAPADYTRTTACVSLGLIFLPIFLKHCFSLPVINALQTIVLCFAHF